MLTGPASAGNGSSCHVFAKGTTETVASKLDARTDYVRTTSLKKNVIIKWIGFRHTSKVEVLRPSPRRRWADWPVNFENVDPLKGNGKGMRLGAESSIEHLCSTEWKQSRKFGSFPEISTTITIKASRWRAANDSFSYSEKRRIEAVVCVISRAQKKKGRSRCYRSNPPWRF